MTYRAWRMAALLAFLFVIAISASSHAGCKELRILASEKAVILFKLRQGMIKQQSLVEEAENEDSKYERQSQLKTIVGQHKALIASIEKVGARVPSECAGG